MHARKFFLLLLVIPAALPRAHAQASNEIGLVIGATVTPARALPSGAPTEVTFSPSLAMGAEYDRRVHTRGHATILVGVDFLASPFDVKLDNPSANVIPQYAYVFLTPHVRVKLNADGALSPWFLFGGGYARYREAAPAAVRSFQAGSNSGALEFGAGVDTATLLRVLRIPIGFRLEARDFYAGTPNYNVSSANWQNNVVFTGGLLVRF